MARRAHAFRLGRAVLGNTWFHPSSSRMGMVQMKGLTRVVDCKRGQGAMVNACWVWVWKGRDCSTYQGWKGRPMGKQAMLLQGERTCMHETLAPLPACQRTAPCTSPMAAPPQQKTTCPPALPTGLPALMGTPP